MKTLYQLIFLSCISLFIACSSDPCEDVTCLNGGTCDDGTCACPDGWTGADCGTFDFDYVGEYTSMMMDFSNCNSSADAGTITPNADDRYCFNLPGGILCQRILLTLRSDGTAVFNDIRTEISGGIEYSRPNRIVGTYQTNAEVITFTETGGSSTITFTVTDDRSAISWIALESSTSTGCRITHKLQK